MVPWDIYLPTPKVTRYYGNATQYGDLFAFIRRLAGLLDATTLAIKIKSPSEGGCTANCNINAIFLLKITLFRGVSALFLHFQ